MATINQINLGTTPDDGTGTAGLHGGGQIINDNDAAINAQAEAISAALGIPALDVDMGVSAGTLLTDNATVKAWFDEVEAAVSGNKVLSAGYTAAAAPIRFPQPTDTLETAISQLHAQLLTVDEGIVMRGAWDASTPFPVAGGAADGTVKAGDLFIVDTAGVVDGIDFQVDDRLVALKDGGGATYAGNWFKRDYSPEFDTALPERATDSVGAVGDSGLNSQGNHKHPLDTISELYTADTTITLDPATGSGVQRLLILDASGPTLTVQPTAGEQINGEVDGTKVYDAGNSQIVAVDVAAGQWNVGPNAVLAETAPVIIYNGPVGTGLVLDGGLNWSKLRDLYQSINVNYSYSSGADAFAAFISTVDLDVAGKTWRFGIDDPSRASFTMQGDVNTGNTFICNGTGGGVKNVTITAVPKLHTFQTGTMLAEPAWEIIAPGNGTWTADETVPLLGGRTWQDILAEFEEIHLSLQENNFSFYRVSANHFTEDLALNGSQDIEIWTYSSGTTGYRMWIEGPRLTDTSLQVANGGHGHRDFVMRGRRKQFNAIRPEDLPVDKTGLAAGDLLEWDGTQLVRTAGPSTDFVNTGNYTGGANNATTQGIYRHTGGALGGAPTANFVWTLDVDVLGDHIKQTFSPRDTGTTVLGYWVRRSFDGGGTWTAWAGR